MTSSPFDGCDRRDTGIDESNAPQLQTDKRPSTTTPSPLPMLRRTAPASRPSGRSAVGLRPSLEPRRLTSAYPAPTEKAKERSAVPLDRPRSFRDDLHKQSAPSRIRTCDT